MSRIIRAVCDTNSIDDKYNRVEVTVEGSFKKLLIDSNNGIYLRKGDSVYIYVEDDYTQPLILGRCSGQLELTDLLDLINNFINVFNNHTHKIPSGFLKSSPVAATGITTLLATVGVTDPVTSSTGTDETKKHSSEQVKDIKPDDVLY